MGEQVQILIVEDSEELLWVVANVLEAAGFTVEGATNGKDALDMASRCSDIRLILMNYVLPDQSGVSVLRELRSRGCQAQVIGISAFEGAQEAFMNAGAFAYLEKPFDGDELVSLCGQVIAETRGAEQDRPLQNKQRKEVKTYGSRKNKCIEQPG
jgi:DNA-binding NtrC family response regulator